MQEQDVRKALASYKKALINAHYRNWWHRVLCWIGDKVAMEAQAALLDVERTTKAIVNQSSAHQAIVRALSLEQPEKVRNVDAFMTLVH